jgi:DNA-binding LacI/PurR family transcriptional regulator
MNGMPLYVEVRNRIKAGIESGTIRPDANGVLPSQQAFAAAYNVSLTTIGKAISELETVGLVVSRRGKGLTLRSPGSSLSEDTTIENRMLHVGVCFFDVLKDMDNPWIRRCMTGIKTFCDENRMAVHTVSFPQPDATSSIDSFFAGFPFMGIDGILLLSPVSVPSISYLVERGIPYAALDLLSDENAVCHIQDNFWGGYKLTDAVLQRRNTVPVLVTEDRNTISARNWLNGYRMALSEHGLGYSADHVCDAVYDVDKAMGAVGDLLAAGVKVGSIIAHDDVIAARLHDALSARGVTDVLIAGSGNFHDQRDKVGITLEWEFETMGYNVTRSLHNMIYGISLSTKKLFYEPAVVTRDWLDA